MNLDTIKAARSVHIGEFLGVKQPHGFSKRIAIRCSFHNEKSPSMILYPDGSYYCFGCRAHGSNAIDYLIQAGLSFNEAVDELYKFR